MKKLFILALTALLFLAGCGNRDLPLEETVPAGSGETHYDKIPMVMVDGQLYYDTGRTNNVLRCGVMDGEITSTVEGWEIPTEDDQSNFGAGYGYQFLDGNIEVLMNDQWWVFEHREGDGSRIRFGDGWLDQSTLSQETIDFIHYYNSLTPEQQAQITDFPDELVCKDLPLASEE